MERAIPSSVVKVRSFVSTAPALNYFYVFFKARSIHFAFFYKMDKSVHTVDILNAKTDDRLEPLHLKLLKEEFQRRCRQNPQFSLRSFAKNLDMDPSLLSKVFRRQRPLSAPQAKKIIEQCKMSASDKKLFWSSLVQERTSQFKALDESQNDGASSSPSVTKQPLSHDLFQMISEPHHYVLAEMARTEGFRSDLPWISKKIGLPKIETHAALQRLVRVGLLKKDGSRYIRCTGRFTTADKTVTDSALKHHQRKFLEAAAEALDTIPLERRSQNAMTIAINPKKIPIAKQMIQDFIGQLASVLETGALEEVYQISVSLFPAEGVTALGKKEPTR